MYVCLKKGLVFLNKWGPIEMLRTLLGYTAGDAKIKCDRFHLAVTTRAPGEVRGHQEVKGSLGKWDATFARWKEYIQVAKYSQYVLQARRDLQHCYLANRFAV